MARGNHDVQKSGFLENPYGSKALFPLSNASKMFGKFRFLGTWLAEEDDEARVKGSPIQFEPQKRSRPKIWACYFFREFSGDYGGIKILV